MMSLRLSEGSDLGRFTALGGSVPEDRIAGLVSDGWLGRTGDTLTTTPAGRLLLNSLLAAILA